MESVSYLEGPERSVPPPHGSSNHRTDAIDRPRPSLPKNRQRVDEITKSLIYMNETESKQDPRIPEPKPITQFFTRRGRRMRSHNRMGDNSYGALPAIMVRGDFEAISVCTMT